MGSELGSECTFLPNWGQSALSYGRTLHSPTDAAQPLRHARANPLRRTVIPRQPRLDLAHVTQHIVQRGNDRYHRTGTLCEGRYKACPVASEAYLLHCHRYLELNPVRAAMTADPADYA